MSIIFTGDTRPRVHVDETTVKQQVLGEIVYLDYKISLGFGFGKEITGLVKAQVRGASQGV